MAGTWIALLTDFGIRDSYAGVLRGVLATLAPHATPIDLTHDIPPGDIRAAAFALWQATPYFPPQTVYLCVVDPGVGTNRRALAAAWPERTCVGPDNGLFSYLIDRDGPPRAVELARPDYQLPGPSATFHGRDVYAPAAAHLASGVALTELGPPIEDLVRLETPRLAAEDGVIAGEVLQADRFGNWITSIGILRREAHGIRLEPWLGQGPALQLAGSSPRVRLASGMELELLRTYQEAPPGEALAYIGSSGLLELGVNAGPTEKLGISRGDPVELRLQT